MSDTSDSPVLEIRDLDICLADGRDTPLVRKVGFEIRPGETLCVVGESGSGKSLTAFSVMGLLDPEALRVTGGEILLQGEDVLKASARRLRELRATRMSIVFQEPMTALNPVERVGAQIDEVLKLHRDDSAAERRRRILDMLDAVHLPDPERIYSSYPHQLSGGQRQRVVICMALILEPKLLIADEPTTALDVTTQRQILALIRELQEQHNTAVLFITHDFGVVADIADRIVVMNKGRVVEIGSRDAILGAPREEYTRMLVTSVPSLVPEARPAIDGEEVLTVSSLSKTFSRRRFLRAPSEVHAVRDLDLSLKRGEILGVVGQSGSGKSTLARCIIRLEEPSSGQVSVCGTEMAHLRGSALRDSRKRIQMVFQDPYRSLNPRVRIGESLAEGPTNYGMSASDATARARELVELVNLPATVLDRYPHQFSGGQRQRLAIARALMMEPDVLVADEAVSALDVSVQAQILALLDRVRKRTGVGVVFITHDLRVAAQICDRVLVMNKGEVVEQGPAGEVLVNPRASYTRELIEAAPGRDWDFRNLAPVA
ncbi:dipeptide ABC transporter ATP-binding protein [Salipiger profundus]|uniref:dipeptide ABC transporter ATP-binding protein n=1 Tax=Salipiger profundus TaxID=1229727 RepID=UPI0008ECF057|nr:ABC transporter ATP-binding protein [Salipiger profundus]SFD77843.1 peptide/nickel transport system ATP-binding protein [Salipiger profundus]